MNRIRPCLLMILDGWGIGPKTPANAVTAARTPFLDRLAKSYPHTRLLCSGEAVGLPPGVMGNSEVGHLNIGAGRIVYQDLMRINRSIQDGSLEKNEALCRVMDRVKASGSALHLLGLVSDGGVHSHLDHLLALVKMARNRGLDRIFIHAVLDGRDTPPDSGAGYVRRIQDTAGPGRIATICGRYFAMDRDKRWDRVQKAYQLYTQGIGISETDPVLAVQNAYNRGETDEFVKPVVMTDASAKPLAVIGDGDGAIFFNFRADRAREITQALTDSRFSGFTRSAFPSFCGFVCMTRYDETFDLPVAFGPVHLKQVLGETISRLGLRQLRIAETEKYAHVTYFFNGGEEAKFPLEDRCLIPSPREVATYDLKPEMSAHEVAGETVARIRSGRYDLIVLNFANMDMVGHTGVFEAAVRACETVDQCVAKVVPEILARNGAVLVTADHGNAECMADENGHPHTAHTLNPVPLILVDETRKSVSLRSEGILADIAPTMLEIMGIEIPGPMTGRGLIQSE
jgi:2,3-bisphosphoglycerate-independent phosphoglycerate mutase